MKFREYTEPILKLLEDAKTAESQLDVGDSQFMRRAYVRSVFAYIEGATWLIKQTSLRVASESGFKPKDLGTYAILNDECYDLNDKGEVTTRSKFLRSSDNLRFAVCNFNSLFRSAIDLGVGAVPWNNFLAAIKVRNRLMHPKNTQEFDVSASEIQSAKNVCWWFNELMKQTMEVMTPL